MASVIIQTVVGQDSNDISIGQAANTYVIPVPTKVIQANVGSDYEDTSKGNTYHGYRIPVASKITQISVSCLGIVEVSQRIIQNQ